MKQIISMFKRQFTTAPLKISLTLVSVALGTAVLILSLSASSIIKNEVSGQLEENGLILYTANGEWDSDGSISLNRPAEWDSSAGSVLVSDSGIVESASIVSSTPFHEFTADGKSYRIRTAIAAEPAYFDVFSLEITAGLPMTDSDLAQGMKKVWISEETAEILFGSAEAAVGKYIQPPGEVFQRGPGGMREQNMITSYTVTGVFKTPGEVSRKSYEIGDVVFPYTAMLPSGRNAQLAKDMMAGTIAVKTSASSVEKAGAAIRQSLTAVYGEEIDILVWEGSPRGTSEYMEELRNSVRIFTVTINLLGIILLLTSSLGIFSIMVVESLSRRREIALQRALGASRLIVVRDFWSWAISLSLCGAAAGAVLSLIFSHPVLQSIAPLAGEISESFAETAGLRAGALITAVLIAVGFGGILGLLPAVSSVQGNIAETIRES